MGGKEGKEGARQLGFHAARVARAARLRAAGWCAAWWRVKGGEVVAVVVGGGVKVAETGRRWREGWRTGRKLWE